MGKGMPPTPLSRDESGNLEVWNCVVVVSFHYLGGKVTAAGWQVTLCDPIWHVISRSGVVISITNCYIRVYFIYLIVRGGTP